MPWTRARSAKGSSACERARLDVAEVPPAPLDRPKRRAVVRSGTSLVVSFLLHLPLLPIALVLSLYWRWERAEEAKKVDYLVNEATIAVDLLEPPKPSPEESLSAKSTAIEVFDDARNGSELGPDRQNAPMGELGESSSIEELSFDQSEAEGSLGTLEDEANVTLSLWMSEMRNHELSPKLASMLACGKLGATLRRVGIDALDDIESAVFAGPRLNDPTQYTAALSHKVSEPRLKRAFARLTWPHGRWLDDSSVRIRAAGATRVLFRRGEHLVMATPERVWEKLRTSSRTVRLPPSRGRAFSLGLREPSMALARLGLDLPETLVRMRLDAYALTGGQVEVRLRFEDRDEVQAQAHRHQIARELELASQQLRQLGKLAALFGPFGTAAVDPKLNLPRFRFGVESKTIVAVARISEADVRRLLDQLVPLVCESNVPMPNAGGMPR